MDNQQRRLEKDKAWFAGIMEGEGSFTLVRGKRVENGEEVYRYIPSCCLSNTDPMLMKEIERILKEQNIGFKTYYRGRRKPTHKECWQLHIIGMKRSIDLIKWILPELRGEKKMKAEKILEFAKIRDEQMTGFHGIRYSEKELELCNEIRGIQNSRTLNDYTPNAER